MVNSFLLLGASDFWMTRWLTPIWLLGVGVTLGLALLILALLIFWILSKIPYFESAYRRGLEPHIIALTAALALGVGVTYYYRELFQPASGDFRSDEMALVAIALSLLLGLFTWSLFFCSNKRFLGEVRSLLLEGIGSYLLTATGAVAVVGLACTFVAESPVEILKSLPQLFQSGDSKVVVTVPASRADQDENPFVPVDVRYRPDLLNRVQIISNRNVILADAANISGFQMTPVTLVANEEVVWSRSQKSAPPIPLVMGLKSTSRTKSLMTLKSHFNSRRFRRFLRFRRC